MLVQFDLSLSKYRGASGVFYPVIDGKANLSQSDGDAAITAGHGVSLDAAGAVGGAQSGGGMAMVSGTLTRPADSSAYAPGDAIANSTTAPSVNVLSGCARINNGSGMIVKAWLVDSANQSTAGQFEVWVFSATHTLANDNAAIAFTDSDCAILVSIIPMQTSYIGLATAGAGGNRVYESDALNHPFVCSGDGTSLYWALVARNAYTPVSAEAFTLKLAIAQD